VVHLEVLLLTILYDGNYMHKVVIKGIPELKEIPELRVIPGL